MVASWMEMLKDENEFVMTQGFLVRGLMDSLTESRNNSVRWAGESLEVQVLMSEEIVRIKETILLRRRF